MRTVWGIFGHDVRRLLRNPVALATVVGMVVLSAAIAWYAAAVLWAPYQNADRVRVAVIDNDEGDTVEGLGEVDVGARVVEDVRIDDSFDWDVVNEQTGRSGLESGEYFAAIVLPPGFTREFASVLKGGTVGEPTLEYLVNQKRSATALEALEAGEGAVDAAINRSFKEIVSQTVAQMAQDDANAAAGEADAESGAGANLGSAQERLADAADSFNKADEAIETWRKNVKDAQDSLDALKETVPDVRTAVADTQTALVEARTAAHKVSATASSVLGEGGAGIVATVKDIAAKVAAVAESVEGVQSQVVGAGEVAREALERNREALDALESISNPSNEVSTAIDSLRTKNEELEKSVDSLETTGETMTDTLSDSVEDAQEASETVVALSEGIGQMNGNLIGEILPKLDTSMDSMALLLGSLSGAVDDQERRIEQAKALLDELDDVLEQTEKALDDTTDSLSDASANVGATRTALSAVADSEFVKKASELAGVDAQTYGAYMAAPVATKVEAVYAPVSYGAMTAPFYANLAIWVFAFMVVAVFRLEADPTLFANTRPWQAYMGRLALFVLLALVQAIVVCVGDLLLGVGAANPVAFVCAGLACAFAFVNVVYALAVVFKHGGKALALVFLAVQIPAVWGAFPAQLAPGALQAARAFLPFTYGTGAMAESIGGFYGNDFAFDLLWLLGFGVAVLAVALLVRPQTVNLNRLVDDKLEQADVFLSEQHDLGATVRQNMTDAQVMLDEEALSGDAIMHARAFERRYEVLKRAIPIAAVVVPVALIAAMSLLGAGADAEGKVLMLLALVAVLVVLLGVGLAVEYTHGNVSRQLKAASASSAQGGYAAAVRDARSGGVRDVRGAQGVREAREARGAREVREAVSRSTRDVRSGGARDAREDRAGAVRETRPATARDARPAASRDARDARPATARDARPDSSTGTRKTVRNLPSIDATDQAQAGSDLGYAQVKPLVSGRAMQAPKGARRAGAASGRTGASSAGHAVGKHGGKHGGGAHGAGQRESGPAAGTHGAGRHGRRRP